MQHQGVSPVLLGDDLLMEVSTMGLYATPSHILAHACTHPSTMHLYLTAALAAPAHHCMHRVACTLVQVLKMLWLRHMAQADKYTGF